MITLSPYKRQLEEAEAAKYQKRAALKGLGDKSGVKGKGKAKISKMESSKSTSESSKSGEGRVNEEWLY